MTLTREEIAQYARHLILPEVGLHGQEKLKAAKVLVLGTGGLGSPVALYLAAAGIGTIGLVDHDVVDASNLQRQVLFDASDVGTRKVSAAARRLRALNPRIEVVEHDARFTSANAHEILSQYDILVDATDNFPTRYLANDVAVMQGKPNVYASIFRFEGQASVFDAKRGPCYRCLYRKPPPPELVPSCAEGGVLGVLPGILGSIQATETLKLILGRGSPLVGQLLLVDALDMEFTRLQLAKDPGCPVCSPNATQRELIDYEAFCGSAPAETGPRIGARELADRLARKEIVLVDVREPHERDIAQIPGGKLLPLGEIAARAHELPMNEDIALYCRSGARSARAVELLRTLGFRRVTSLEGGILAWSEDVDPSVPRY